MTAGSVRKAMIRIAPPQRGQRSGSTSKSRRNNSAQRRRGVQGHLERERHGLREHHGWRTFLVRPARRGDVRATLAEIVAKKRSGRRNDDDIVVFDSTGVAIEDVAAAAVAFERSVREGAGLEVMLASHD
jgi:hypothetical protein